MTSEKGKSSWKREIKDGSKESKIKDRGLIEFEKGSQLELGQNFCPTCGTPIGKGNKYCSIDCIPVGEKK